MQTITGGGGGIDRNIQSRILREIYRMRAIYDDKNNRVYTDTQILVRTTRMVKYYWPTLPDNIANARAVYFFDEVRRAVDDYTREYKPVADDINRRKITQEEKTRLKEEAKKEIAKDYLHPEGLEFVGYNQRRRKEREERAKRAKQAVEARKKEYKPEKEWKKEKKEREAPHGWLNIPSLKSPESFGGKIFRVLAAAGIGLGISALLGNMWFVLAFLLWSIYSIIPGPMDIKAVQNRLEMLKRNFDKRLKKAATDTERKNLMKRMEVEMGIWKILGELNMRNVVGGGTIGKEAARVFGCIFFVLGFVTSAIPSAKPLGLIVAFVTYFMISYEKKPPVVEEKKGGK